MALNLDMTRDIAPRFEITVRIVGQKRWIFRLYIARQLLRLAACVANMGIKFEEKPYSASDI